MCFKYRIKNYGIVTNLKDTQFTGIITHIGRDIRYTVWQYVNDTFQIDGVEINGFSSATV